MATYNVTSYGATGNGTTDDTAAIVAAVNAANTAGLGTVYLPAGTYLISWAGSGQPTTGNMFHVGQHTVVTGASQGTTTILMAPSQGNYNRIFTCWNGDSTITFQNFTFDQNGPNTGGTPSGANGVRQIITFINNLNSLVTGCRFTNVVCDQAVAIYGDSGSVTVQNNIFDNVGLNTTLQSAWYDHSTVYSDSGNTVVTGNTFTGRLVGGTTIGASGATTAIEIHGFNQTTTHNTVSYYQTGCNVGTSNSGYSNYNQLYQWNTFNSVGGMFVLYIGGNPLTGSQILNNTATIDVLDYSNSNAGRGGIYSPSTAAGGTTGDLVISNNSISFINYSGASGFTIPYDGFGIAIQTGTSDVYTNLVIDNNTISNCLVREYF